MRYASCSAGESLTPSPCPVCVRGERLSAGPPHPGVRFQPDAGRGGGSRCILIVVRLVLGCFSRSVRIWAVARFRKSRKSWLFWSWLFPGPGYPQKAQREQKAQKDLGIRCCPHTTSY